MAAMRQAYRKLSRKYHPDKGGSEAEFQALGEAHDCLKEPFQRMMYDSWLKGDQSEPFNKGGFPDLSEMWAEGEGCMPKLKNAGLVLVLLLVFALMALYGIVVDWWEYVGEVCAELKRATLASFTDEDKAKMLEQMGGEEEIKAQLVLYGLLATFLGWWVGGWTWCVTRGPLVSCRAPLRPVLTISGASRYEAEADAIEAASGWFGDGWAAWLTGWLWELLDSLGVFSLGWFDGLLPEGGLFGSSSVNMSSEEGLSAAPAATAEVSAAPEAGALDGTGVLADPDALFPVRSHDDYYAVLSCELIHCGGGRTTTRYRTVWRVLPQMRWRLPQMRWRLRRRGVGRARCGTKVNNHTDISHICRVPALAYAVVILPLRPAYVGGLALL